MKRKVTKKGNKFYSKWELEVEEKIYIACGIIAGTCILIEVFRYLACN